MNLPSKVIKISGSDADKFLQGQLTCDVLGIKLGQSTLGAYCSIKGKVQSLFKLHRTEDGFLMQMPSELLQTTMQELQKYAVFSKVTLALLEYDLAPTNDLDEILNKIPALYTNTVEAFFPHDINLPELGAVSFTKGCYRGQEIVARMQHRGNLKRSMYLLSTTGNMAPGDAVTANDGTNAGTIVRAAAHDEGMMGLAVITHAMLDQPLLVHGTAVIVNM